MITLQSHMQANMEKMRLECQRLLAELQTLSQALADQGGAQ